MVNRTPRGIEMEGYPPMHLVARENSKRLVNVSYMRLFEPRDCRERTIGGPDFIELNKPIVYEGLNDLLHRLGNCKVFSPMLPLRLFYGAWAPIPFIFGPNFSSSLSFDGKRFNRGLNIKY